MHKPTGCSAELVSRAGDLDEPGVSIWSYNISDGRRDDRCARCEEFRRLRGADEASGLVEGKRHDTDIPAADVGWQILVVFGPQPMNVFQPRQTCRIDLYNRSDHDELPVRSL